MYPSPRPQRFEAMLDDPATSEEVRSVLMQLLEESQDRAEALKEARDEDQ